MERSWLTSWSTKYFHCLCEKMNFCQFVHIILQRNLCEVWYPWYTVTCVIWKEYVFVKSRIDCWEIHRVDLERLWPLGVLFVFVCFVLTSRSFKMLCSLLLRIDVMFFWFRFLVIRCCQSWVSLFLFPPSSTFWVFDFCELFFKTPTFYPRI